MKINIERLERNISELAKIGRNSRGGIDRALGDKTDEEVNIPVMLMVSGV